MDDAELAGKYEGVLVSIKNEYFDIIGGPDADTWFPSEKARVLTTNKYKNKKK